MARTRKVTASNTRTTSATSAIDEIPVSPDPTAAAFFDVDNTMMQGASIYYLARGLAARKYFTSGGSAPLRLAAASVPGAGHRTWRRHGAGDRRGAGVRRGLARRRRARLSEEIFDELMAPGSGPARTRWPGTTSTQGSGSGWSRAAPVELGAVIAAAARADRRDRHGRRDRRRRYTGRLVGDLMHGPAKAAAIASWPPWRAWTCAAARVQRLDQRLADAHHGRAAVAVNPDSALRRVASQRGWTVHDFRTGRKAARIALPSTAVAGLVAGAVSAGLAVRRRRFRR